MPSSEAVFWRLLHLADSAFPTGGFVHSGGIEAALALRLVERDTVESWLAHALGQCAQGFLPLVAATHADPTRMAEIDTLTEAWLWNPPANRASRAQGLAWLKTTSLAFPGHGLEDLRPAHSPGHLAPVLGAVLARLGFSSDQAVRLVLHLHLRSLISSAIRLGLVGPLEAQAIQARLAPALEEAATRQVPLGDLATTTPLADIAHLHHDRLYSRLFAT